MTETCSWEVCDYSAQSDDELKSHAIEKEDFDNIQIMFDEYNSENFKLLDNFSINQNTLRYSKPVKQESNLFMYSNLRIKIP